MSSPAIKDFPGEIIRRKRDGQRLDDAAIGCFVAGLADGSLPVEQVAALAMAIYLNGMDPAETAALTRAMAASGTVIDWAGDALPGPVLDKHSTGGVGDKVSLMLAPLVAACGAYVPMISGRGLGHTGGTLDKLAAIPGYDTHPDLDRFRAVVRSTGCAIIGQTGQLAPADGRLYAIRDVTATIESLPLITASILSKKLAAGVRGLVMDIKIGSGAFMATGDRARALAGVMDRTAAAMSLPMQVAITDMGQVLGSTAGNAVEVAETIAWLTGSVRDPRLDAVVMALAAEMLVLGGLAPDHQAGLTMAEGAVSSGAAAERFARMVTALGGPADLIEHPGRHLPAAPVVLPVLPDSAGYLADVDARAIGNAIISLGGGRRRIDDVVDPAVGFTRVLPIGAQTGPDQPLALVHAASADAAQRGVLEFRKACIVAPEPPAVRAVIHQIGPDRPNERARGSSQLP